MQIEIQALSFPFSHAMIRHFIHRLVLTLSVHDENIQHIKVQLSYISGARGGADKRCQIHAVLSRLPDVVIQDEDIDLYVAIDRAVDRTTRTVDRRLNHHRDRSSSAISSIFLAPIELSDSFETIH